ncbi:MAG: epoxyqueuosine reductase [Euryarchaeota archaeon]|nr:epoxyqueuosine reductase [Euryarchaeota archaeon]
MNQDLRNVLLQRCESMDIPLVGIANVERWKSPLFLPWIPEEFYPQSIYPEARSVIVIGLPIPLPVLETSPSIYYRELYNTVNTLLDQYTYRLANFLTERGYPSVFVPRDGYGNVEVLLENPIAFFSHRHAALLSGLGTFGVNNMVLTPEYGPRVRFGSILSTADLPPDPILETQLCTRCMHCVKMCPTNALSGKVYPEGLTDKKTCSSYSAGLNKRYISPCGICIKVCPIGNDRKLFHRDDNTIYVDEDRFANYHRAWKHVRSYGGKAP